MKKSIISIVALLLSASIIAFVSCSKYWDVQTERIEGKTHLASLPLGIASKNGEMHFYFDKEEYIRLFEKCIRENLGDNYVLEDVKIVDRDLSNMDSIAELQQTIFDLESGKTINLFSLLDKRSDGNNVEYIFTSDKPKRDVTCEGTNCQGGGCSPNADRTDCTPCGNEQGTCKKTDKPGQSGWGITWKDVIGWGVAILIALLTK